MAEDISHGAIIEKNTFDKSTRRVPLLFKQKPNWRQSPVQCSETQSLKMLKGRQIWTWNGYQEYIQTLNYAGSDFL